MTQISSSILRDRTDGRSFGRRAREMPNKIKKKKHDQHNCEKLGPAYLFGRASRHGGRTEELSLRCSAAVQREGGQQVVVIDPAAALRACGEY